MPDSLDQEDTRLLGTPLTRRILGCALEVHTALGPGLLEAAYRSALARELEIRHLSCQLEVPIPFIYKGTSIECAFRADMVVEGKVLLELKCVEALRPVHGAQLLTYLKLTNIHVGLLMNFNGVNLRHGLKRFVV